MRRQQPTTWAAFFADAENWACSSCKETAKPSSAKWRWNGSAWEHHHGYPLGHVLAERKATAERTA